MLKTYLTLSVLLFISFYTSAQLNNGLVAHWNFNGNVNDATGSGMNGTPFNISYTTDKSGGANTAALFNGTNSYVDVPYNAAMNNANFSICAIVKVNAFYTGICQANAVLWRGDQFLPGYYSLIYFENPFDGSCLIQSLTKNVFAGQVSSATGTTTQWQYTPTIVTQQWYCVVTTYDGSTSRIYVDGVLKSTFAVPQPVGSNTQGLSIGANMYAKSDTHPYWMNGAIDDLRLYNRVLSQLEIDSFCDIFKSPVTEPEVSISQPVSPTAFCAPATFQLHYNVTAPFNQGNVFTAQLSDATGSFAVPTNIGSVTATGAGIITCSIPANTATGNGYRVRIASSLPAKTSIDNGVNINIGEPPRIVIPARTVGTCIDGSLNLSVQTTPANVNTTWRAPDGLIYVGNNMSISNVTNKDSGIYVISAGNNHCVTTDSLIVAIYNPYFILGGDTTLCETQTLKLQARSLPGSRYVWQDGSTESEYTVREQGVYYVTAANSCGSFGSNIQVDYIPCKCSPFMPDAFTPNNDGLNDHVRPILNCIPHSYKLIIANRWGNIVFETDDYTKKWDGRHTTVPADVATYSYLILLTDKLGNKTIHKGNLILMR